MKLFILIILVSFYGDLPAQNFDWVKVQRFDDSNDSKALGTDQYGNVFTFVFFNEYNTTLVRGGVISKYENTGLLTWADTVENIQNIRTASIAMDGSFYMIGSFRSPATFGSMTLTTSNSVGVFFVQYDANGNCIRAEVMNAADGYSTTEIKFNPLGGYYITGNFNAPTVLGNGTLTGSGYYVASFDQAGNCVWVKTSSYGHPSWQAHITVNDSGDIYLTREYFSPITFDNGLSVSTSNDHNWFIAKYEEDGNLSWVNSFGKANANYIVTENGNVIIGGSFSNSTISLNNTTFTKSGSGNSFIAKYDHNGNVVWARTITGNNGIYSLSALSTGELYITGLFAGTNRFDTQTVVGPSTKSSLFIVKVNSSTGMEEWVKTIIPDTIDLSNPSQLSVKEIVINKSTHDIFINGEFSNEIVFDNIVVGGYPYPGAYLAKLTDQALGLNIIEKGLEQLNIYPNPTGSVVTINYTTQATSPCTVTIKNQLGQCLSSKTYPATGELNETIDLSGYTKGVYFIELSAGELNEVHVKKLFFFVLNLSLLNFTQAQQVNWVKEHPLSDIGYH